MQVALALMTLCSPLLGDFVRFAVTLAYDGTDFHGFWRAPGLRTVGSELDAAFARCGLEGVQAVCASRTDRGVHAAGQVVHFDAPRPLNPLVFLRTLSHQCPLDLRPCAIAPVSASWHAAHAVTQKTYTYTIDASALGDPFAARFAWQIPRLRPLQELQDLASSLIGPFDATSLRSRGEHRQNLLCIISQALWFQDKSRCLFTITADRCTYHLVRSLVGSMVQGLDPRLPSSTRHQAPAKGLCLTGIQHEPAPLWMTIDGGGPCAQDCRRQEES